jgi:hypothetical protein
MTQFEEWTNPCYSIASRIPPSPLSTRVYKFRAGGDEPYTVAAQPAACAATVTERFCWNTYTQVSCKPANVQLSWRFRSGSFPFEIWEQGSARLTRSAQDSQWRRRDSGFYQTNSTVAGPQALLPNELPGSPSFCETNPNASARKLPTNRPQRFCLGSFFHFKLRHHVMERAQVLLPLTGTGMYRPVDFNDGCVYTGVQSPAGMRRKSLM